MCLAPDNCLRQACRDLVETNIFELTVIFAIITLMVLMTFDNGDEESQALQATVDLVSNIFFTGEMLLKMLAYGFSNHWLSDLALI